MSLINFEANYRSLTNWFEKEYSVIRVKYLSWFMGFGQTAAKSQSAIYKVQSFRQHVYPAMPGLASFFLIFLRSMSAALVTGKGTYDRMKLPDTDFIYDHETETENYYELWVDYYRKLAEYHETQSSLNHDKIILQLILEFYLQKKFNDENAVAQFVSALSDSFGKDVINRLVVKHEMVETLTIDKNAPINHNSPAEYQLKKLINSTDIYRISLGNFSFQLDLSKETLATNKNDVTELSKQEQEQTEEFKHYSSFYRLYTKLTDELAINDDYSASLLINISAKKKLETILSQEGTSLDQEYITKADAEIKGASNLQTYKDGILAELRAKQKALIEADVIEAHDDEEQQRTLLLNYKRSRELIYQYYLVVLYKKDQQSYEQCKNLLFKKIENEKQYIVALKSFTTEDEAAILKALDNQKLGLRQHLSKNYAGKYEKFFGGSFTFHISNTNVLVFTLYSAISMYLVALSTLGLPFAVALGMLIGVVTFYVSISYGKNGILSTYAKLGRSLDWWQYGDTENPIRPVWKSVTFNSIVGVASIVTSPLLYVTILPLVTSLMLWLGFAAAIASPLGIIICGGLVTIATVASLGLSCSQGSKLDETFRKHFGVNSVLYKKARKEKMRGIYFAAVFFAVIAATASITISVVGDIFGINKLLKPFLKTDDNFLVLPAILSMIANAAQEFADVISNFLKLAFNAFKKSKTDKAKSTQADDSANGSKENKPTATEINTGNDLAASNDLASSSNNDTQKPTSEIELANFSINNFSESLEGDEAMERIAARKPSSPARALVLLTKSLKNSENTSSDITEDAEFSDQETDVSKHLYDSESRSRSNSGEGNRRLLVEFDMFNKEKGVSHSIKSSNLTIKTIPEERAGDLRGDGSDSPSPPDTFTDQMDNNSWWGVRTSTST